MATARADPLRSTLDNLQLDPRSEADRPYLIAMLRRLGYTEREIEEVVRTGKMPASAPADDGLAPARDYRLVLPSGDSRFALDNVGGAATDAPFEDLERVEFEDPANDVVFEELPEAAEPDWGDASATGAPDERATGTDGLQWQDADAEAAEAAEGEAEELAERQPQPGEPGFEEGAIDTFGAGEVGGVPRTRVRVRRIRASSKEEAERKVASSGRNVIKSVPVDIVERWGADAKGAPKKDADADARKEG